MTGFSSRRFFQLFYRTTTNCLHFRCRKVTFQAEYFRFCKTLFDTYQCLPIGILFSDKISSAVFPRHRKEKVSFCWIDFFQICSIWQKQSIAQRELFQTFRWKKGRKYCKYINHFEMFSNRIILSAILLNLQSDETFS